MHNVADAPVRFAVSETGVVYAAVFATVAPGAVGTGPLALIALDASGTQLWARRIDVRAVASVEVGRDGRIYVAGNFASSASFGGMGTLTTTASGNVSFVARFEADGSFGTSLMREQSPNVRWATGDAAGLMYLHLSGVSPSRIEVVDVADVNTPVCTFSTPGDWEAVTANPSGGGVIFAERTVSTPPWPMSVRSLSSTCHIDWTLDLTGAGRIWDISSNLSSRTVTFVAECAVSTSTACALPAFSAPTGTGSDALVVELDPTTGVPLQARNVGGTGSLLPMGACSLPDHTLVLAAQQELGRAFTFGTASVSGTMFVGAITPGGMEAGYYTGADVGQSNPSALGRIRFLGDRLVTTGWRNATGGSFLGSNPMDTFLVSMPPP